ncbi:MAG TPA: helix-turn-helix domain-containing protein [Edaphocola sp.]|nr:helix-turn-helix domain-containing protein [Edaphocola sp.]
MILKSNLLPFGNSKESGDKKVTNENCTVGSVEATLSVIGGKWKPIILYYLAPKTRRFGEIAVRIPRISRKVLTEQLRELERDKLVDRKYYKEIPPRVEYSLTELGRSLTPVFKEMAKWGDEHILSKL